MLIHIYQRQFIFSVSTLWEIQFVQYNFRVCCFFLIGFLIVCGKNIYRGNIQVRREIWLVCMKIFSNLVYFNFKWLLYLEGYLRPYFNNVFLVSWDYFLPSCFNSLLIVSINKGINNHRLKETSSFAPGFFHLLYLLSSYHCTRISTTFRVSQTESMPYLPSPPMNIVNWSWLLCLEKIWPHRLYWTKPVAHIYPKTHTHSTTWKKFHHTEFFLCAKILI